MVPTPQETVFGADLPPDLCASYRSLDPSPDRIEAGRPEDCLCPRMTAAA